MPELVQLNITPVQTFGGNKYQLNYATTAKQVRMDDGIDMQTRIQTIERAVSGQTSTRIVQTIEERDALTGLIAGDQVWVLDATADDTVEKGGAKYLYMLDQTWLKIAEAESMDIVFNWELLQDKPTSTVAEIDLAVAKQHNHPNMEVLTHLEDDGTGALLFNGKRVGDGQVWVTRVSSLEEVPANLANGGIILLETAAAAGENTGEGTGSEDPGDYTGSEDVNP